MEAKRARLKEIVRKVLQDNPKGIKRDHLWNFVAKRLGKSPSASDYGFGKMSQMFPLIQDLYQEFKVGHDVLIKLKPQGLTSGSEVVSSDEEDFPSLLSSQGAKKKTTSPRGNKGQGSSKTGPRSSDSFLSLDVSASKPLSRKEKFDSLKESLVKLLKKHGLIVKSQLWGHYQCEYKSTPKGSDYGVAKMADVIERFTDVIQEQEVDGVPHLVLRSEKVQKKQALPKWGQGLSSMAPGIGKTSHDRISSSDEDSSDSDVILEETRTFINSVQQRNQPAASSSQSHRPVPILSQSTGAPMMQSPGQRPQIPPLMRLHPQPPQPLPLMRMFQPVTGQLPQGHLGFSGVQRGGPQPAFMNQQAQMNQHMNQQAHINQHMNQQQAQKSSPRPTPSPSGSRSGSLDRSSSSRDRSLSRDRQPDNSRASSRLQRKDITISQVPCSRGIPSREQVDIVAKECINVLADANEHVSVERIEKLICQRYNIRGLFEFQIRHVDQLPSVNEHNRLLCKVNMYVQAFVKSRSVCSLYELSECMREFTKDKTDNFESLKLGPLQRLPVVYDMFKFPCDEEIPEITTMDLLEHLRDYLSKYNKWTEKIEFEPVMNYLVEAYNLDNAYQLGLRIRSLPLSVQMLKKSQRDAAAMRRGITEGFKEEFKKDLHGAFKKFQAVVLQQGEDGKSEVRGHYLKLKPEVAIMEIFQKFQLLMSIDAPDTKAQMRRHKQMEGSINSFLLTIQGDQMAALLFHLAICVGNTTLEESAMELLAPPSPPSQESSSREDNSAARQPPSKGSVMEKLKTYIERCLAHGSLTLHDLDRIEEKLLEVFEYTNFPLMGFGRFLHFITTDPAVKSLLDECGVTMSSGSTGGRETESMFRPQMTDVLMMVCQCLEAGLKQAEAIEGALHDQFRVTDVKQLGYGNISRLTSAAEKPGKHKSREQTIVYEAAVAGNSGHVRDGQVGIMGGQSRDQALSCLHNCPLLEDLSEWSHWSMVFEPQFGKLKDFLLKYGGVFTFNIEGGTKKVTTDIVAMETSPGKLVRLVSQTSPEIFQQALAAMDVGLTCGHLVSMVIMNKGLENTPIALLANQMKTALFTMHASSQTPGAPPDVVMSDPAVVFVLECLLKLPLRVCVALANQILLEPLGQVVGATKSKSLLLTSSKQTRELQYLHQLETLGCLLGIPEWTDSLMGKCQPAPGSVTEIYSQAEVKELLQQGEEIVQDSESEEESESESESDLDDLDPLSDEEQIPPAEKAREGKKEEESGEGKGKEEEAEEEEEEEANMTAESLLSEEGSPTKDGAQSSDTTTETTKDEPDEENQKETVDQDEPKMSQCQIIIEEIRREEFGIGVELNEDGQRLMRVQQERLGRSLDRLSKDLYSKDTHFVLELVQNADDNSYPDAILKNEKDLCPSVKFRMDSDGVTVLNNENGFREKDIRALCDVGRSTKGKHKFGYIGQKGIGFKSVFRVTDGPEVHSNGFHIKFDVKSGPTGYILPHWLDVDEDEQEGWTTKIYLPLKDEMSLQTRSLAARFNDIHPSLLLFLHRLREITVENLIECSVVTMRRRDLGDRIVEIDHGTKIDRWLVVKKLLDASNISIQAKSGVDVESTEIALAFPLQAKDQKLQMQVLPTKQPVFAFLPLRSYGFRFIIQGDFDVPSSREDVDRDSPWNQWLRNEIHTLFIETLDIFKSHPEFRDMQALSAYLQFVPMEDEILDFFRPVASQILGKLRAKECLPVQTSKKGTVQLKIPSQTVIVKDPLVKEVIPPDVLQKNLNLFYLHQDLTLTLSPTLAQSLGVESITVDHLLQIGKSLTLSFETDSIDTAKRVLTIAKWLACVYRALDEFHENETVFERLKTTRIIPLSTGQLVSLQEQTVFLPPVDSQPSQQRGKDLIWALHRDLSMVHTGLLTTPDNEVNSQVQKLLQRVGVKQMSPYDIIHHHILPTLKSDMCMSKPREILISYLVFIKTQAERQASLINMAELKSLAVVVTNHGLQKPSEVAVHFTKAYGNKIDLQHQLPGYDWILLDAVYLNQVATQRDVQLWHDFFLTLGVTDFLSVISQEVHLTKESMTGTPWEPLRDMWPASPTGFHITDYVCEEFTALVTKNRQPGTLIEQLKLVFEILDRDWDSKYCKFQLVQVKDGNGQVLRDAESSFSIALTSSKWVPTLQISLVESPDGGFRMHEEFAVMQPSLLYRSDPRIRSLLAHAVYYLGVSSNPQSSFTQYLRIKTTVETKVVKDLLIEWGKREEDSTTPRVFRSCLGHLKAVYQHLFDNLSNKDLQDLFHLHQVIFVPDSRLQDSNDQIFVQGKMLGREDVWWNDPSRLFHKYQGLMADLHSELAHKHTIMHLYQDLGDSFLRSARIDIGPRLADFADLLCLIVSVYSPSDRLVLSDVLAIFATIGHEALKIEQNLGNQTDLQIRSTEVNTAVKKLKKQKIFPTKKDVWVGVDENPMVADSRELEKMFSEEQNVHLLQLEEPGTGAGARRHRQQRRGPRGSEQSRWNPEAIESFIRLFHVASLSDCVRMEDMTEMTALCPSLQGYAHRVVPSIQCYLFNNYDYIYEKQVSEKNIVANLKRIVFQQVSKLEVIYTLSNNPEPRVIRTEKCMQNGTTFYFHKNHIESYIDINREIAKYFSCGDEECFKFLKTFLGELKTAMTSDESFEDLLERNGMDPLPDEEELWEVPPPIIPEPVRPPSRQVSVADSGDTTPVEGDGAMKSWPPQSSASLDPDNMAARKTKNVDRPAESKIWPPPKPPEYHKQVRDLPANIRVIHRSESVQSETSSVKGEQREATGGRTGDIIIIKTGERPQTTPTEGQTDTEDGAGTIKRKLSEVDTSEAKRPTPQAGSHEASPSGRVRSVSQSESDTSQREATPSSSTSSVPSDQGQGTPGAKRRHIASENEMTPSAKKPVFFKPGDPTWTESASELVYEDLGHGLDLQVPEPIVVSDNIADMTEVGRWGERLVRDYFLRHHGFHTDILEVRWVNEAKESGLPYDFEVLCQEGEGQDQRKLYVEVKSTLRDEKKHFEISSREVMFAREHGDLYQIYRIFNVGDPENVKLLRIDNIALKMDQGKVKLFMYI